MQKFRGGKKVYRAKLLIRVAAGALACTMASYPAQASAQSASANIDIPAQPLAQSLMQLSRQANVSIVADSSLTRNRRAPAVRGAMSVEQALDRLLAQSGLAYRANGSSFIVERRQAGANSREVLGGSRSSGVAGNEGNRISSAAENEEATQRSEIVVTGTSIRGINPPGSRIQRIDRTDIENSGFDNITDLVESLPANFPDTGADSYALPNDARYSFPAATGVNLRGLGPDATLVLLDGVRLASGGLNSRFVDVSTIPISMIERVEILADGASATYGTDAVGGVVNYIIRRDFRGLESRADYSFTTRGGGDRLTLSQLGGVNWGTGGAAASFSYIRTDPITSEQRDFSSGQGGYWITPRIRQYSGFASFHQDLSDRVSFSAVGLYSDASIFQKLGNRGALIDTATDTKQLSLSSTLLADIGGGWTGDLAGTYGRNENASTNSFGSQSGETEAYSARARLQGPLIELPAGPVRVAVGGEFRNESLFREGTAAFAFGAFNGDRRIWAGFGEIYIPLLSNPERGEALNVSLAARYEHYSDFGNTLNPKAGITYSPTGDIRLRATIGRAFKAPDFADLYGSSSALLINAPDPQSATGSTPTLWVTGASPDLEPQKATTFSAGFDVTPVAVPGLEFNATYFRIRYSGRIARPNLPALDPLRDPANSPFIMRDISQVELTRIFNALEQFTNVTQLGPPFGPPRGLSDVTILADNRLTNVSSSNIDGMDISIRYDSRGQQSGWYARLDGTWLFHYANRFAEGRPLVPILNTLYNPVDIRVRASAGLRRGHFSLNGSANYTDNYRTQRLNGVSIGSWLTFDANLAYTLGEPGTRGATTFRVSAFNIFDRSPPFASTSLGLIVPGYDPANANPYGRQIVASITHRW